MQVLGIDIGFGFTKVYSGQKECVFPSKVAPWVPSEFDSLPYVVVNNNKYLTGHFVDDAGVDSIPTTFAGFTETPYWLALFTRACLEMGAYKVSACLGFPPKMFSQEYLSRVTENLKKACLGDGNVTVQVDRVYFVPQGMGAFIAYAYSNHSVMEEKVVVMDLGFYTFDFVVVNKGKYQGFEGYDKGIKYLVDMVKSKVSKVYHLFIDDTQAEQALKEGYFIHFGRVYEVDLTEELKNYKEYLKGVIRAYAQKIGGGVQRVLLAGGGFNVIGPLTGGQLIENPWMANAKGYYLWAIKQEGGQNYESNS